MLVRVNSAFWDMIRDWDPRCYALVNAAPRRQQMELTGYRVAILAENQYEDLELWYPYYRFQEAGADVFVVGSGTAESYTSKHGYPVRTDADADTVVAEQFDAIIVPGGWAPDYMRRAPAMIELVRQAAAHGKLVAAICHGGWVLASAGVVRGRTVTGYFSIRDDLTNAGANYVDQEVVRDGNLVTSRQPSDLPAFCREAIAALQDIGRTAHVAHRVLA
jgi:protease I